MDKLVRKIEIPLAKRAIERAGRAVYLGLDALGVAAKIRCE